MHEEQLTTLAILVGAALAGCVAVIVALWRARRAVQFPADEAPRRHHA